MPPGTGQIASLLTINLLEKVVVRGDLLEALMQAFVLPPAELRSAAPHSGPSQNLLRHRFAITCIFRAPPPALSGGGYVRLMAAQKLCSRSAWPAIMSDRSLPLSL